MISDKQEGEQRQLALFLENEQNATGDNFLCEFHANSTNWAISLNSNCLPNFTSFCQTNKCYYKVLGIGRNASREEIKKARNQLARQHHPDRHSGSAERELAEEQFKLISEAYRVLSDPVLRNWYDRTGTWGLQFHRNWNLAKQRAAESAIRPFHYLPMRQALTMFGKEREYHEIEQAVQAGESIPEPLASTLRNLALGNIVFAVQEAVSRQFQCAKCKKVIDGLEELCYCLETKNVGPHCRNNCCPNCASYWPKFFIDTANFFNTIGEYFTMK